METTTTATCRRTAWNKGKLIGQKAPLKLKEIWQSGFGCSSNVERENWRYSTWRSTANYAVAIWSVFAFTM